MTVPLGHPVTGRPMNQRPVFRRRTFDALTPWMPANAIAAGVPAADVILPPWLAYSGSGSLTAQNAATNRGTILVRTGAAANDTGTLSVVPSFLVGPQANDWPHMVGLHLMGLRLGDIIGTPSTFNQMAFEISLSNAAKTSGITLRQSRTTANTFAEIVVHGDATYPLDGSDIYAFEMLSNRTHNVGLMLDPYEKQAIIYRINPGDDAAKPIVVFPVPNVNLTNPIQPRVTVTALTTSARMAQIARVDLDDWTW